MAHIAQILAEGCLSPPRCCNKPSSFVFQCFAPRCFAEEERDLQSHRRARCSLHHRAEAPGDLVVTEPAPAGSSPVLGKLIFPLEALVPVGIPGSHNLPDHRTQITGLSAVKKQRGEEEEVLFPPLSSPIFARPLSGYQESCLSPGAHVLSARWEAVGEEGVWDLGTNWRVTSRQLPRDQSCSSVCTAALNLLAGNEEGLICTRAPHFCETLGLPCASLLFFHGHI